MGWWLGTSLLACATFGRADDALMSTTASQPSQVAAAEATPDAPSPTDADAGAPTGTTAAQSTGNVNFPLNPLTTPAFTYGTMSRATCEAELSRRKIAFTRVPDARGVLAPERLTGKLHGVAFHSALPASQRPTSPYEILDCRLILALDDFSIILAKADIVEVVHMSVYRPPYSRTWPAGTLGTQHDGALAIDAGSFIKKDGTTLQVERDFHGAIGAATCGAGTGPNPATPYAPSMPCAFSEASSAVAPAFSNGKATSSMTVSKRWTFGSCSESATGGLSSLPRGSPENLSEPDSAKRGSPQWSPAMCSSNSVLPQPLGPTITSGTPAWVAKLASDKSRSPLNVSPNSSATTSAANLAS